MDELGAIIREIMNQLTFLPCTYREYPRLRPILDGHSDVFNFLHKRLILSQVSKSLDESFASQTTFVALHDGLVVGFLGGVRDNKNPFQLNMFCLVSKKGYPSQEITTQLFDHVCQVTTDQGFRSVMASIFGTYPHRTKKYYQSLGFKQWFGQGYTGASDEDVMMVRSLTMGND